MEALSDNALMLKVKNGDLDQMGLLFERYKKILFGFFYNMNHDAELSEDLVQNTFMRIIKYRKSFKGDGSFKVWMFHIARNISHDQFRKNSWRTNEDLDKWNDLIVDEVQNREQEMTKTEDTKLLHLALLKLDREKREILILSKLEELKYQQIAEVLSCSEGAVKVKVFRALKALKVVYKQLEMSI